MGALWVRGMGATLGKSGDVTVAMHSYSPISDIVNGLKINVMLLESLASMMMFRPGSTN